MLCTFALCVAFAGFLTPPGPPHDPMFGFNDNSVGFGILDARAVMARQAQIPARAGNVHRYTVDWRNVEPAPGVRRWEPYDRIYREALAHGLHPLPILLNAPPWAKGRGGACSPVEPFCLSPPDRTPAAMAAWRAFAAEAARRWPEAVALEVWNEPNLRSFWTTAAGPDPDYFGDVLCHAYAAIKAERHDVVVLLGGLANPVTDPARGTISERDFLAALYRHGAARVCNDALSLHPYPAQRHPDPPRSNFLAHLDQARAVMAAHGDAGRRIWITEFGYFAGRPAPAADEQAAQVDEGRQAHWLACAYRMAAAMPDVDAFLVHTLFDPGTDAGNREHTFGVNRHPALGGGPKPAHDALVALFRDADRVVPAASC